MVEADLLLLRHMFWDREPEQGESVGTSWEAKGDGRDLKSEHRGKLTGEVSKICKVSQDIPVGHIVLCEGLRHDQRDMLGMETSGKNMVVAVRPRIFFDNISSTYFQICFNIVIIWLVVWNIFIFPYIGNNHPN